MFYSELLVLAFQVPGQKGPASLSREWKPQETHFQFAGTAFLSLCSFLRKHAEGQGSPGEGQDPWSRAMPHTEGQQTSHPWSRHTNIFFSPVRGSRGQWSGDREAIAAACGPLADS